MQSAQAQFDFDDGGHGQSFHVTNPYSNPEISTGFIYDNDGS
jgi:hypothetical protein